MDIDRVVDDLNRRFTAPLPEFYNRRIIFWIDEEGEFKDSIESLELSDAKVAILTGTNNFTVKKLLSVDDTSSNYVVYRPYAIEKDDDNWLLNIELYSEEFRSDLLSIWMDEMGISSNISMRKYVKEYRKFFNAIARRKKVKALIEKKEISTEAHLHLIVMASICQLSNTHPTPIIKAVLSNGLQQDSNNIYQELENYGAVKGFWAMVAQATGYNEADKSLENLAIHILLTSLTRTMKSEYLIGLEKFISVTHQAYCYDFIADWLRSDENEILYEIARFIEEEISIVQRFNSIPLSDIVDTECFPCVNECILTKLMTDINNHLIDVDVISSVVEKRRTFVWYDKSQNYFDGILQVSNMQGFYKEYSGNFHTVEAKSVWKEYTENYYKMDTYYRLFHLSYSKFLAQSHSLLDDLFKQVKDIVEGLYTNWFLGKLGENWTNACSEELKDHGYVMEIPKQEDFYREKISNSDSRIYVIISDALRYEVAASLAEQLKRESQANVELGSMQAIFPAITKFGMAALLPHKELTAEIRGDKLAVLADGISTESNCRDKILKNHNQDSIAINYKYIVTMKRAERSELVKGKDVVYIYHDKIDEVGHSSEDAVFPASEDAIIEIKNLIRIIVNDFSGSRIIVTADHGFLYTYSPLSEDGKVDSNTFKNRMVEYSRRYAISMDEEIPDYLLPVKMFNGKSEFYGFTPSESIRIKMNGGNLNFVHGGISLQEIVVPVIEYRHLRNSTKEYQNNKQKYDTKPVTVSLLSSSKKISNMIFGLNFYQTEAVSHNRESATYILYFVDSSGNHVSDTQKIIADKTSDNGNERTFRLNFNLKPLKYSNTEIYYLMIGTENGLTLPTREEFQIDIAFSGEEYDFFS